MFDDDSWKVNGRSLDVAYGVLQSYSADIMLCHIARLQWEREVNGSRFVDVPRVANREASIQKIADLIRAGWLEFRSSERKGKKIDMVRLTREAKVKIFAETRWS